MIKKIDRKNKFVSMFNPNTGFYIRSGVIEDGKDTGIDPFMTAFPELLDIGVMGHCVHGASGLCIKSGVQCYQNGLKTKFPNMSFEKFDEQLQSCNLYPKCNVVRKTRKRGRPKKNAEEVSQ